MSLQNDLSDHWILPVVNGFVQIELCYMDFEENLQAGALEAIMLSEFGDKKPKAPLRYGIGVISRRSRHRAGK